MYIKNQSNIPVVLEAGGTYDETLATVALPEIPIIVMGVEVSQRIIFRQR